MVAEAFAIFAVVAGAIGTINIVKGWIVDLCSLVQQWQEFGDTIQDLAVGIQGSAAELAVWKRLWGLDDEAITLRYLQAIWHEDDIDAIVAHLTTIQATSSKC